MKKNITVNIFGTLYHIDEDAYELLQKYNENMRRYYASREGGDEISDDVEHRVAELMSELQSQGVLAITIEHVKDIIERIGDPREMDEGEQGEEPRSESDQPSGGAAPFSSTEGASRREETNTPHADTRKLFRDGEDKIVGGVVSGICHYMGINDPLLLRLVVALLIFVTFPTVAIIYVILWLLIPEAVTPEERLRMYGKPVSAKAINEELVRGVNSANQFVNNPQHRDTARGCLSFVAKFFLFCIGAFFLFIFGVVLAALLAAIFGVSAAALFGGLEMINFPFHINLVGDVISKRLLIAAILSTLLVISLPLFGLARLMFKSKDSGNLSTATKVCLVVLWIASLGVMIGTWSQVARKADVEINSTLKKHFTRDGIYLTSGAWKLLDKEGWEVELLKGINEHLNHWGLLPRGEGSYLRLTASDNPGDMSYTLSQERELRPGSYKVEAWVRSDGEGNSLYVITNQGKDTLRVDIPSCDPRLFDDSDDWAVKEKLQGEQSPSDEEVVIDSNDNSMLWTHVEGTFDVKEQEKVKFGISNESNLHNAPWNSHEISIASLKIKTNN
ncbi:MAG: PspC domain-containing protein [Prevotella sp.]|nr:PspC domain-containing protein [Prevotella sp.]